jgi:hypothetical protein
MRGAAATAGMLSAAVLLSPGCGSSDEQNGTGETAEPLRWATFRVLAARDFLATCPAAAGRPEPIRAAERFDELRRFAARKGAAQALWLAENDYGGVARHGGREPCGTGNEAFGQALAVLNGALDELGGRIAAMPQ